MSSMSIYLNLYQRKWLIMFLWNFVKNLLRKGMYFVQIILILVCLIMESNIIL